MGRSRMFDGEVPERTEQDEERDEALGGPASPRTTIVGGRPPEPPGAPPPVPTGIQRLLRLAAIDPAFLSQLVERRDAAAPAAGVDLTATERMVLRAASREQLEAMAAHLPPVEPARRDFLRQSAATAVVLLGGAALAACEACGGPQPTPVRGATADVPPGPVPVPPPPAPGPSPFAEPPPPRPDVNDMQTEGGAAPDEPPPPPPPPYPPPGGARPDLPPPRPEQVLPVAGVPPDLPPERPESARPTRGIRPDVPPERK